MICNFCGKTLSDIDEDVLGEQQIVFPYGSSDCIDKLADEFIARCKYEPKIIQFGTILPSWENKTTEETDY